MTPTLSLLVWFFVLIIIFFVFWYFLGYTAWPSFAISILIALIILIAIFPWDFNNRHPHVRDCDNWSHKLFGLLIVLSLIVLIFYIIGTYFWLY